jgi:hypothetical protein
MASPASSASFFSKTVKDVEVVSLAHHVLSNLLSLFSHNIEVAEGSFDPPSLLSQPLFFSPVKD